MIVANRVSGVGVPGEWADEGICRTATGATVATTAAPDRRCDRENRHNPGSPPPAPPLPLFMSVSCCFSRGGAL